MADTLTDAMSKSATGYAAVVDGILDIRTVTDDALLAILLGLRTIGVYAVPIRQSPDNDPAELIAALPDEFRKRIELVEISVAVIPKGT